MKVSHECPLVLLEDSRTFNDYDYALVHLFSEIPEYYNFFVESLKQGREVILDNSVFELGESYNADMFVEWINKLQPTYYIIPDVLDDTKSTIENLKRFVESYPILPGKRIGVIQGKTYDEMCYCYKEIEPLVDKVAIPFDSKSYFDMLSQETFESNWHLWCRGRQTLLKRMLEDGVINTSKPHHLLGIALPQEIKQYRGYDWIDSIDTSNPIVHGLHKVYYNEGELDFKISTKLVDLIHCDIDVEQLKAISHNLNSFKNNLK